MAEVVQADGEESVVNQGGSVSRAEYAHILDRRIHECAIKTSRRVYQLMHYLGTMKKYELYKELGYDSFEQYLASVDIGLSLSQINMGLRVLKNFFENEAVYLPVKRAINEITGSDIDLSTIPVSKLDDVLPAVKELVSEGREREAAELVLMARPPDEGGLSRSDLQERLIELGHKRRVTRSYLCLKNVSVAEVVETDNVEELLAKQYDIIIVEPRFVKGRGSVVGESPNC